MQVKILGELYDILNDPYSVKIIFDKINQIIKDGNWGFSHMNIDGTEIFEEHYDYIIDNLDQIKCIDVELKSVKELMDEVLLSTENYIKRAIPVIKELVDDFYTGPSQDSWFIFDQLLEGLQWLDQMVNLIDQTNQSYDGWIECIEISVLLKNELYNLEDALKNSDMILIGDIINYEILPLLQSLYSKVTQFIDNEVARDDIN